MRIVAPARAGELIPADGCVHKAVGSLVILLGRNLSTDISAERVVAVRPLYPTAVLGLGRRAYGVIGGLYHGVTAAVRPSGGVVGDLTRRPKMTAATGCPISTECRLALPDGAVLPRERVG